MYNMTPQTLPAPYQLNKPSPSPLTTYGFNSPISDSITPSMYPAMKRGGRAKSRGFTTVHMNPHEIAIMEHLQGGNSRYNKNGVKEFHHLEQLLKNPHILQNAHHHARAHHAEGGSTTEDIQHLREGGRFGDSELAAIGPHTQNFFNQLAGHPTENPYTGHPEYWGIGDALKGILGAVKGGAKLVGGLGRSAIQTAGNIGRTVAGTAATVGRAAAPHLTGIAKEALPAVLPMAQEALGNRFGGLGQVAGQALGGAATHALGPQEGPVNPYHEAFGRAFGHGVESYRGGASPRQAFGQGVQTAGSHLGGGIGGAMEGMGRSVGAGNNAGNVLRSGAHAGFNAMGGRQGLQDMASNVAQGFGNGGFQGARTSARQQMNDYRSRAMPQFQSNMDYGHGYPDEMEQYA